MAVMHEAVVVPLLQVKVEVIMGDLILMPMNQVVILVNHQMKKIEITTPNSSYFKWKRRRRYLSS
eukprot:7303416-Ditylum_brightwellii.AAC.1